MTLKESFDRMYRSVSIMEARFAESDRCPDLTYMDMLYLDIILLTPDCTVTDLAEMLNVSMPAVTRRINILEEKGFVTRVRQEGDARRKSVVLSERGKGMMADEDRAISAILERMETSFSAQEVDTFCRMLDGVADLFAASRRGEDVGPVICPVFRLRMTDRAEGLSTKSA